MATILGITTDQAAALMRAYSGRRSICGASLGELVWALRSSGCQLGGSGIQFSNQERPTLAAWLKTFDVPRDQHVIVIHGNHYGVILNRQYLCSLTSRQRVAFAQIPKRRGRVLGWITVNALPANIPSMPTPPRAPEEPGLRKARADAKLQSQLHDIEIERLDGGGFNVWPPAPIIDTDLDPHEGDHYASSWFEVADRVAEYALILTTKVPA